MNLAKPLLAWYHQHRRNLPFREDATPYNVWISEIMLQQTRVAAALPYYERFTAALPDVAALAACDEQLLLKLWEGLGYYSRARNLQKAARLVMERHGGAIPGDYAALLALPGIGPYTAGAIASIAFGLPAVAVDGNVLRVFSRLFAERGDIAEPAVKKALARLVQTHQPPAAPGDYNQALMELGALVCLPGAPHCDDCPLRGLCKGRGEGIAASLPQKAPKPDKKELPVCVMVVRSKDKILLRRRPVGGLLAGLWEPVVLEGRLTKAQAARKLQEILPGAVPGDPLPDARHVFTHRVWHMYGWLAKAEPTAPAEEGFFWAPAAELQHRYALPSAFKAYFPWLLLQ